MEMTKFWRLLLVFLSCLTHVYDCSKIVLLTVPMYSHCLEISSIGHELVSRGHDVSIVLGSSFKHGNCHKKSFDGKTSITEIIFTDDPDSASIETATKQFKADFKSDKEFSWLRNIKAVFTLMHGIGVRILNKEGIQTLKELDFDLAIVDGKMGMFMYCMYLIPYRLEIPYVTSSTVFSDFTSGRPFLPSIVPSPQTSFTDNMSFLQKLSNAASHIGIHLLSKYSMPMDVVGEICPGMTRDEVVQLAAESELYIFNIDPILDYPVPKMPNHVFAGGIATRPAESLTGLFEQVYSAPSTKTVVLVTFGSTFTLLPDEVETRLSNALKKIDACVFWKYTTNETDGNMHQVTWLPQNDLLENPKTKLFVSHCGQNGLFEALYHGVPVLCTPMFGDQFYNAARVKHWNVGKELRLITSTEENIVSAITEMLQNPVYTRNMRKASEMYRSQHLTPRERAATAIEFILRFGGTHLRSRASELSTFSYMGYDIICFLLCFAIGSTFLLIKVLRCCCCRCMRDKTKYKQS